MLNGKVWQEVQHNVVVLSAVANAPNNYTSTMTPANSENGVGQWITPPYEGSASVKASPNIHAPNLATTNLKDAEGKVLYSAVRHAALDPTGFNPEFIENASPQELRALLDRYYSGNRSSFSNTEEMVQFLRAPENQRALGSATESMQEEIADNMAQEVVKTYLLNDPKRYELAMDGRQLSAARFGRACQSFSFAYQCH